MTAKEFLQRVHTIKQTIKAREEQIMDLKELAVKTSSDMGRVKVDGTHRHNKTEDTVIKLVDLQCDIQKDIEQLVKVFTEVRDIIKKVDDDTYRLLLELRYLNFKTWEQIAVDLSPSPDAPYSDRWAYVLHKRALSEVDKKIVGNVPEKTSL